MKTWLRSRKFFMQVLTLTLGLLLILCTVFTIYLYANARRSTNDAIFHSEFERSTDLLRQSDIYINQMISISSSFATLAIPYEELSISGNYWARTTLDKMLDSHMAANSYIENIDIVVGNHSLSPTRTTQEKLLGNFSIFDIYTENTPEWPYNFDLVSTYGNRYNKVTISISAHYLSRQIFTYNAKERQDYLLTPEGNILLANQQDCFFTNVDSILPGMLSQNTLGFSSLTLQTYEDDYFVLSEPDKYGFQILSLVPKAYYSAQFTAILLQTILMAAFLFLMALLISLFLTMRFYRPVKKTIELLQAYIPENLHDYENEIAFIHQNMAKYLEKEKSANTTQTFSRIQNAQIAVLQHQINSHFLYNTLESIKAISVTELGIDNEVENSIFMLGSIIQEGVFQKNMIVPLSHEIFLSKCYLELMQIRFPDVTVMWNIDETLNDCQVLKFILQPILENCFSHAFAGSTTARKCIEITISGAKPNSHNLSKKESGADYTETLKEAQIMTHTSETEESQLVSMNQDLWICIRDNGVGLTDEFLTIMDHYLNTTEEAENSHVGIRNVHKRIVDVFGQPYGLTIRNSRPGTMVEVRIPLS